VPSLYVRATSWLPVIASFDATVDPMVVSGEPERILVRGGQLKVDSETYVVGPNTLSGQVLAADGVTAMPDDGGFSLRISAWESEADVLFEGPLELASDGSWSVELTVTDELQAEGLLLTVFYDGMRVAGWLLYEVSHEPIPTIAEIADESGGFTGLVAALTAADLFSTFADPEAGPFTVFAPTDDAFAALITYFNDAFELELADLDDLIDEVGVAYLLDLLTYHALDSVVDAFMLEEGATFATLFGPEPLLEVTVLDSLYVFNDIAMATVTDVDIEASNGVIHVIDTVLLPYLPAFD